MASNTYVEQAKQEAEAVEKANGGVEGGIIVQESVQETVAPQEAASVEHEAGLSSVDVEKVAKRIVSLITSLMFCILAKLTDLC